MGRRTGLERGPYRLWGVFLLQFAEAGDQPSSQRAPEAKKWRQLSKRSGGGRGATPQWLGPSSIFSSLCLLEGFLPERQLFHGLGTVGREEACDTWPLVLMKATLICRQNLLPGNRITCKQSFQTQEKRVRESREWILRVPYNHYWRGSDRQLMFTQCLLYARLHLTHGISSVLPATLCGLFPSP